MNEIILKIEETAQRHVGKGLGVIDPKIVKENNWQTGQIIEITANKKSHVKVWPGSSEDYGSGIIRIDGITRHNIGAGIGEKANLRIVDSAPAQQITLSPIEKISVEGLQEYMSTLYEGHVFTTGDTILVNTSLGGKTQLIITATIPQKPVIVTPKTVFNLSSMTKAVDNSIPRITYDELGGLKKEVQKIREMVEIGRAHV